MKIAYFSPLPPTRSGIADYSWELLPSLANSAEITLFHDNPAQLPKHNLPVLPLDQYSQQRWEFDLPLYHIGNSPHHADLYALFQQHPGVVVLHDYVLHHFMMFQAYARELTYAYGAEVGNNIWTGAQPITPFVHPLNERVLDLALGVIVHSAYVAERIRQTHPALPVAVAPMPMPSATLHARNPEKPLTFGCLGIVSPHKHVDMALRVFGRFHAQNPHSRFHIIGESPDIDLNALIKTLPAAAQKHVEWRGFVPTLDDLANEIDQLDIVINLRHPTAGETSAAALRALAHGKPVIVFDNGWYRELPAPIAAKIPPLNEGALLQAMHGLSNDLSAISAAAHHHIATQHAPDKAAEVYSAFLKQTFNR